MSKTEHRARIQGVNWPRLLIGLRHFPEASSPIPIFVSAAIQIDHCFALISPLARSRAKGLGPQPAGSRSPLTTEQTRVISDNRKISKHIEPNRELLVRHMDLGYFER